MRPVFHVYATRRGNIFMLEIAELLAAAISDLGFETVLPTEGLPEDRAGVVNLVVAPHEFFTLHPESTPAELLAAAAASTCVGVEQPGTYWFDLTVHFASVGRSALDISHFAVEESILRGLDAEHLQLGWHPSWDHFGGDVEASRSRDLLFLGSMTDRRAQFLGDAAPLLWDLRADLRLFEYPRPMSQPRGRFLAGAAKRDLLADSRVLLNVHRNEVPYFEWVRALEAVCNGCLLVTESSSDYGPLEAGKHLVATPLETLGALAASLVLDESLRREIVTEAYDFVRRELALTELIAPICEKLAAEAYLPSPGRRAFALPRPRHPHDPASAPGELISGVRATDARVRARIKELLDSETELSQALEGLEARLRYGDAHHREVLTSPAWEDFEPEVSVLVTSYNYASFLVDALGSVLSSEDVAVELVVYDDHSSDGSAELLRGFVEEHPWFPVKALLASANAGVGPARNAGFEAARAEQVFVLDADNYVYPNAIRKLLDALRADPTAAFSFGMIGRLGLPGLLSHIPWDVGRLLENNYIDAMALLRRSVWERLGGYDTAESSLKGWEDYELWLRIAATGGHGAFVPQLVGAYRVHGSSRQQTVDLDTVSLHAELRDRYPYLPWAHAR
ncbi:MAG: glycosyltransferase [Actinomycetota bacterium]|nr:glycosyltransferase [Actinomycetota bacterium]